MPARNWLTAEFRRRTSSRVTETAARGGRDAALAAMLALAAYAAPTQSVPAGRFPA